MPIIYALVGSKKLKLIIDTGSAYNIFRKSYLEYLSDKMISWKTKTLVGIGVGEQRQETATVFGLEIGNEFCTPMKTLFLDGRRLSQLCPGQSVDGVLGYEYLSQVKFTIDFRNRWIFIDKLPDPDKRMSQLAWLGSPCLLSLTWK